MPLSDAARSVWAKSSRTDDGWMPLQRHLEDSAAVAGLLWDRWLPLVVKQRISSALPGGDADGRLLLTWLAGIHDVGKATPAFAVQAPSLADRMHDHGLLTRVRPNDPVRRAVRHELAGFDLLMRWLAGRGWADRQRAMTYAVVLGAHHGTPPSSGMLASPRRNPDLMGSGLWRDVQDEFLDHMAATAGVDPRLDAWSQVSVPYPVQVLLSAAVIVADWIASDETLFAYGEPTPSPERAAAAWRSLDLPAPWRPLPPPRPDQIFADRFALPVSAAPRAVQLAAVHAAAGLQAPGLLIVEAPMGAGKTEAALAVAEVMAHRFGASGVFVALPTMATSNAMFARVRRWVERLPVEEDDADLTLFLAHGKAGLNPEFASLWRAAPGAVGVDESPQGARQAAAVAHSWLRGRKRGVLSSFVVGTIDQVLFAGLKSRHLALRHLALAGKVVIIDEVHAVDVYMSSYLERVLQWLGAYGVPTVMLSATLPAAQRRALVVAYDAGAAAAAGDQAPDAALFEGLDGDIGYPVITASTGGRPLVRVAAQEGSPTRVVLERLDDDDASLVAALEQALVEGGCVAVVRNTVARAQDTYELLSTRLDAEVILAHSRFLATDRSTREQELVERLGPPDAVRAAGRERPHRIVVVGTQVIEQSLDIDFDLMVTDLAPVDLVLQRLGRLHRHQRGIDQAERPAAMRVPRALVTGVRDWAADPPLAVKGSEAVYGRSGLLRAAAVLAVSLQLGALTLPDDIASLVQAAYVADFAPPAGWEEVFAGAEAVRHRHEADQRERAEVFRLGPVKKRGSSLVDWVEGTAGEADGDSPRAQAQVRDTEDTLEVVVVQRVDGEVRLLPWATDHAGRVVATDGPPPLNVAKAAATCTVRLPLQVTRGSLGDAVIRELERSCFAGWQESPWLAGQLALVLDESFTAQLPGHHLAYHQDRGLVVTTDKESS